MSALEIKHGSLLTFTDWPCTREATTNKPGQRLWRPLNLVQSKPLSLFLVAALPASPCLPPPHPLCARLCLCSKKIKTEANSSGSSQICSITGRIVHIFPSPERSCQKGLFNHSFYAEPGEGALVTSSPHHQLFCLSPWAGKTC